MKHEGWLSWATPSGQIKRYYQLVGCYLIRFKDEKSAKGTAIFPTYVHGVESIVEGAQEVSKEFIADMENRGSSFYLYTPTRTMTLYAGNIKEQKAWIAAVNDALKEAYTADEITKKEASQDFKKAVSDGQPPPMGALRAVCLTKLMEKTYEGFKETPAYKAYVDEAKGGGSAEPIPQDAQRLLIYTPNDPSALKKRLQKMTHAKTKLKSVGKKDDGEKIYEAWTFLKSKEGKDKSTTIGRDHKQDVAVDDDKKVSREHARIDCTGDGKVIFMDLGSSHGSKVNGKSVAGRVSLAVGDVIKVGKTKILFTIIPAGAEDPIR